MDFDRYVGMASAVGIVLILVLVTWLGLWGPIDLNLIKEWQTLIGFGGTLAVGGVAWINVSRQIRQQRIGTRLSLLSREEDRIEGDLPGLKDAALFCEAISQALKDVDDIDKFTVRLREVSIAVKTSKVRDTINGLLPATDDRVRRVLIARVQRLVARCASAHLTFNEGREGAPLDTNEAQLTEEASARYEFQMASVKDAVEEIRRFGVKLRSDVRWKISRLSKIRSEIEDRTHVKANSERRPQMVITMKLPRTAIGFIIAILLLFSVVGNLGFAHAFSTGGTHCFASFQSAQWPKWIGCAMAVHESLAGGLIGLAGAIFAAWLAYSGAQDQLRQVRRTAEQAERLRAQERFQEAANEIDALKLAEGYLRSFVNNFPNEDDPHYSTHNFLGTLWELDRRARVYLSQSAANAPKGFGRSITTVMWRIEKLAEKNADLNAHGALIGKTKNTLEQEVRSAVSGAQKIADDINELLPSLIDRMVNLKDQYDNLSQ